MIHFYYGWDPFAIADNKKTPQDVALENKHTELATWLGELKEENLPSAIMKTATNSNINSNNMNSKDKISKTNSLTKMYNEGLYWAVVHSNYDIVHEALQNGVLLETTFEYPQYKIVDIDTSNDDKYNNKNTEKSFDGYISNYKHVASGWTALHVAASFDDENGIKLAKLLVSNGWDPLEPDNSYFTPIDMISTNKSNKIK